MKACVLHAVGDLRFEEVPKSVPGAGEVSIRVGACGVCGSDIPRVFTKGTYRLPTIPGHEFAGQVEGVGEGVDPQWIGRRVAVFPLIPCRKCAACEIGAFAQCADYNYLGSRCDGAFAEYVCAPVWNLVPVPDNVPIEEAAMTEPAAVAAHALRQAGLDLGDTVAIFGAGPIGLLLGLWARIWGAGRVLLIDIDPAKLDFARTLGFDDLCNAAACDAPVRVREITGRGADVVIEGSGSSAAFGQCMQATRTFGKVVLMGNPAGEMKLSQSAYWEILRKELTVRGTWNSQFSALPRNEWRLALDAMASGALDVKPLITHRVGLDGLAGALVMMRDRTAFSNKVMLETP
ncbi:MAG: L-iditol 2-dehydrogenase [Candidatus Hydrogenedentes bacterium]|nr:L-iditol 2-dehydrogenase [Candidatus Hydrogenedentota bacterium]